jgi:hypothetical protein
VAPAKITAEPATAAIECHIYSISKIDIFCTSSKEVANPTKGMHPSLLTFSSPEIPKMIQFMKIILWWSIYTKWAKHC